MTTAAKLKIAIKKSVAALLATSLVLVSFVLSPSALAISSFGPRQGGQGGQVGHGGHAGHPTHGSPVAAKPAPPHPHPGTHSAHGSHNHRHHRHSYLNHHNGHHNHRHGHRSSHWWWAAPAALGALAYWHYQHAPRVVVTQPTSAVLVPTAVASPTALPAAFPATQVVYPAPNQVQGFDPNYWYYCPSSRVYYPHAASCDELWMKVVPTQPTAGQGVNY